MINNYQYDITCTNTEDDWANNAQHAQVICHTSESILEKEREEKLCTELMEARNTDQDFARLELMACHDFTMEEVEEMDQGQVCSILARERVKVWLEERLTNTHQMTNMEADEMIRRNLLLPAIFHNGRGIYRRFRSGQRVVVGTDGNLEHNGIINELYPDYEPYSAYEIETSEGVHLTIPEDADHYIQEEVGSKILAEDIFSDWNLLRKVQLEVESGFPYCTALRHMHGNGYDNSCTHSSKLNLYHCHNCGRHPTNADKKLIICTSCHSAAYCDRTCQQNHWQEHEHVCKIIEEGETEGEYANESRRRCVRSHSMIRNRYHALASFFSNKCGLPFGATSILRSIVTRAVEASLLAKKVEKEDGIDCREEALQMLANEISEDVLKSKALTSQNLLRLIAGVVHFREVDQDLAAWCAAGVDTFLLASFNRAIVPELPRKYAEPHMYYGTYI